MPDTGTKAFPELLGPLQQKLLQVQLSCIPVGLAADSQSLPGSRGSWAQRPGNMERSSSAHTQVTLFQMHTDRFGPSIRIFCFIYFSHTFVIVHFPWKKRLRGKYIISFSLKSDSTSLTNNDFFLSAHTTDVEKMHFIIF